MTKLTLASVGSLEHYLQQRPIFRQAVIAHKNNRRLALGPNATLHFEDYLTMKYQVLEMMRAERLSDAIAIQQEIDAYNPLIPDGRNLKCTLMLEFPDTNERRHQLRKLIGVETSVLIQIDDFAAVAPIADEDVSRCTEEKTSAVHFLRYEFSSDMIFAAKNGAKWAVFCNHPAYRYHISELPGHLTRALCQDFD